VATDQNPADVVSRGLMPGDAKWGLFINGPDFLYKKESLWDKQYEKVVSIEIGSMEMEEEGEKGLRAIRIVEKIEKWSGKLERLAWFSKSFRPLKKWLKDKSEAVVRRITLKDLKMAERDLILAIQKKWFKKEIEGLVKLKVNEVDGEKFDGVLVDGKFNDEKIDGEKLEHIGSDKIDREK